MMFKESDVLELKESLQLRDEIGKAVSAFANSGKGKILVGVTDKGKVLGLQIGRRTLHDLVNFIKENTDPHIYPDISVKKISNKNIIEIRVKESHQKPVFFKGRVYKRVGTTSQRVPVSEIRALLKESEQIFWDSKVCQQASLKDLDLAFVRRYFLPLYEQISKRKITGKAQNVLAHLGCIKKGKPTNAGILLFGKNPQKFFINSYIALARYKGNEIGTERLDYKEFEGNLFQQIDDCEAYIKQHIAMMSKQYPYRVRREDIPEYGLFSVRELVTNAVCHRDYENQHTKVIVRMFDKRIEVDNPGGLPDHITPKNILSKQFSRNPVISKVLAKVGYIEDLGEGWNKIIKEHKRHLLRPKLPLIEADNSSTVVTLFSTKDKFMEEKTTIELSERQEKIIDYIRTNKKISTSICAKLLNISSDTALRELTKLKKEAIIVRKGVGRTIYYVLK